MSVATSTGHQFSRSSILNSKVSKQIHDQQKTSLCWAYAISTMLRSSLLMFIEATPTRPEIKAIAFFNLKKNEFHKRLRSEIVMMPIPKPSVMHHKLIGHQNTEKLMDEIIDKQLHNLEFAILRVSYCLIRNH